MGNVIEGKEVSIRDPQEFPHSEGRVIHATKATQKKRGVKQYPLAVKTAVYELYTQSAGVSFTHRFH